MLRNGHNIKLTYGKIYITDVRRTDLEYGRRQYGWWIEPARNVRKGTPMKKLLLAVLLSSALAGGAQAADLGCASLADRRCSRGPGVFLDRVLCAVLMWLRLGPGPL